MVMNLGHAVATFGLNLLLPLVVGYGLRRAGVLSAMISNRNTAGTITVFLPHGEEGFAYSRLFVALNWAYPLLICYPLAQRYGRLRDGVR
jgi:hypothetical protein